MGLLLWIMGLCFLWAPNVKFKKEKKKKDFGSS